MVAHVHKYCDMLINDDALVKLNPTDDVTTYYSIEPQTSEISRITCKQRDEIDAILKKPYVLLNNLTNKENRNLVTTKKLSMKDGEINIGIIQNT
ncbi:unnamed protein product [Rotaria sordida]|uniref:Uncharacterized protein n=1 Tax=Rotaria sordida TaxID=392033 RepID=A0A815GKY6_9BILA|nr:unnamed protein product [Rotaria sordida]CAF1596357.1 unnamed protein product [Rotaria sordida]